MADENPDQKPDGGNIREQVPLDDGIYPCTWGGYEVSLDCCVQITINEKTHRSYRHRLTLHATDGIRTINASAILRVRNGVGRVVAR